MSRVFVFTNIFPHYRKSLWEKLLLNPENEFYFFSGDNPASGIELINFEGYQFQPLKNRIHFVKNSWIKGKVLIWQHDVIIRCLKDKFEHAIFLGEMYCLSTWLAAIICRLKGIEVVFWGHGLYGNEGKIKLFIRKTFYRLANKHLLYERRAKQLMINEGFNSEKLYVVFNSLDYDEHLKLRRQFQELTKPDIFSFFKNPSLPTLVFIGRLTSVKKLDLLIKAANKINRKKTSVNLLIIGDGSERISLEKIGENGLQNSWVHFTGACYNEEEIGKYLYVADLCVSPGNIGLTAIHSLSFGTPICTHDNFKNQMPEYETIIDGYNGFFFKENDVDDLTKKIENWVTTNQNRKIIHQQCYEIIDRYYNPNSQLSVFNRLIENKKPEI